MSKQLSYQRKGQGDVLVLVHGYLGSSEMWRDQIECFSEHFDVIAPDLPGFGKSNAFEAPESIAGFAEAVLKLMDSLGVDQFNLLGHSMGGMIVQEIAINASSRLRSLICYGTGPISVLPSRFETVEQSRQRILNEGLDVTAKRIAATWFVNGEQGPGFDLCLEQGEQASLQAALACLTAWDNWDALSRLNAIACRTLVLWGDKDRSCGWEQPEAIWKTVPGASLAVVPGCAHNVHMEKTDLFNALVVDFIK